MLRRLLRFLFANAIALTMRPGRPYYDSWRWKKVLRPYALWRDGYRCRICKRPMGTKLDVHHRRPLAKGGSHFTWNLQCLCFSDHAAQHPGNEFLQIRASRD